MAIAELRLTDQSVKNLAQGTYNSGMLDIAFFIILMRHVIYQGYISRQQGNVCHS